jgi:hypothetical protein
VGLQIPLKSIIIDGNCRVEDRGLKTHHGQVSYISPLQNISRKTKVCLFRRAGSFLTRLLIITSVNFADDLFAMHLQQERKGESNHGLLTLQHF